MPLHITDTLACWVADSWPLVMEGSLVGGGVEWITWVYRYSFITYSLSYLGMRWIVCLWFQCVLTVQMYRRVVHSLGLGKRFILGTSIQEMLTGLSDQIPHLNHGLNDAIQKKIRVHQAEKSF